MKTIKSILSATLCLVVICLVVTGAVAGTRYAFSDEILQQEQEQQRKTMSKLLKAEDYQLLTKENDEQGQFYQALTAQKVTGYIAVTAAYGYGSDVSVMTAITATGQVAGIEILDASQETPGLGQNVTRKDFTEQFREITAAPAVTKNTPTAADEIQAVTGATRSSNAVAAAVTKALALYDAFAKEDK
ncbi:FMN-binding protein [Enterococcus sp. AD013-P3]|uniref:FMN-binding protein n=1 Tax=Enterococcus sp. AD013-P3 TaxID=3411036 RepID=UPI003B959BD7